MNDTFQKLWDRFPSAYHDKLRVVIARDSPPVWTARTQFERFGYGGERPRTAEGISPGAALEDLIGKHLTEKDYEMPGDVYGQFGQAVLDIWTKMLRGDLNQRYKGIELSFSPIGIVELSCPLEPTPYRRIGDQWEPLVISNVEPQTVTDALASLNKDLGNLLNLGASHGR